MYVNGPKIITDGLVLAVDAGNTKSYPSSGTTWTDLSGNTNTGTLTNGPTFNGENGGSIVFDGTNDSVQFGNILNVDTSDFTLELWFYKDTQVTTFPKIVSKGRFLTTGWRINQENNSIGLQFGNPQQGVSSPATVINNRWHHGVITRLAGNITVYIDGSGGSSTNFTGTLSDAANNYQIAAVTAASENWKGRISVYRHYNIGFTQAMILQNFNATRSRFGV
jgi:hypothetical protein